MAIGFQMRVLTDKYSGLGTFVCFMPPCVVQLFQQFSLEQVKSFVPSFHFDTFDHVLLPVCDCFEASASHWSLLIVSRLSDSVRMSHFDSNCQANGDDASRFAAKFAELCDFASYEFELLECPVQENGFDCGVYVMAYADRFAECRADHTAACESLTPEYITQYRKEVRNHMLRLGGRLTE
jgi:sentrin-specific protease 8